MEPALLSQDRSLHALFNSASVRHELPLWTGFRANKSVGHAEHAGFGVNAVDRFPDFHRIPVLLLKSHIKSPSSPLSLPRGPDVKTSVASLLALAVCLPTCAADNRLSTPEVLFRAQSPPLIAQGTGIQAQGTAPGFPAPAPSGVIDGSQTWNAFSPPAGVPVMSDPIYGQSNGAVVPPTPYQAYQPVTPFGQDPFLAQPGMAPQMGPPQGFTSPGANGPRPYRFGWQQRLQIHWLSDERVSRGIAGGSFGVFGLDYEMQWTQQMPGWIYISTPQFGMRSWDGPAVVGLPGNVFRFGWDIRMETPRNHGPYSLMLAFNPSVNSDFEHNLSSDAWNLDGRGAFIFQLDQYWQMILGIQYWDRVSDRVLPFAGLIYTDDFWEWRLTFPEARISLFLGSEYYWAKWLYVRGEYHVEGYEVNTRVAGMNRAEQVELEDWRILVGLKMDTGYYDWFLEAGWVFGREVAFGGPTPGFDVGTGFIGQIGVRF